ncbi:MAG: SRPBCC family protein [Sphingobacteriaceae bacterium]
MAIIYPEMYNHPEKYNTGNTENHFNLRDEDINLNTPERIFSVVAGSFLLYSGIKSLFRSPLTGVSKLVAAGTLLSRGASGYCPIYDQLGADSTKPEVINIKQQLTVNKPREEVYQFWRKLENLPLFMRHIESVEETDAIHSRWKAKFAKNVPPVSWNAEIVKEIPNHFIGWHSVKGSVIDHGGKVEFNDLIGGGTELQVVFSYQSPIGNLGTGIAKLFTPSLEKIIREDILYFKHFIETKEVPDAKTV